MGSQYGGVVIRLLVFQALPSVQRLVYWEPHQVILMLLTKTQAAGSMIR
jgi:hypothetical protein